MNQSRFQGRVGLFVVVCLVLMAALLLAFSKGAGLFTPTYEIKMRLANVSGLKERSAVLLAGVPVGTLKRIELAQGGTSVLLHLQIQRKYPIQTNAEFVVEQVGVLGDQFVAIHPSTNAAPSAALNNGDEVTGKEPFNLQEAARSASAVLVRMSQLSTDVSALVGDLREAVTNAKNSVFSPPALSNLTVTIANFRQVSEHTLAAAEKIEVVVRTNSQPLTKSISNLVAFSAHLCTVASNLDQTILTNRVGVRESVDNFQAATASLKSIASNLDAGQGLAGALLKDPKLQTQWSETVSNLAILSSNLSHYGLLYKPRSPRPPTVHGEFSGKKLF